MLTKARRSSRAAVCACLLVSVLAVPAQAAQSKAVDMDGDGVNESTVVFTVVGTLFPTMKNQVFNNSDESPIFNWLNAGPGGFRSQAPAHGESRWEWSTSSTVYSFTGSSCRNDMCTFDRSLSLLGGAFNVPGRTVNPGQVTSSAGTLTSTMIQSFSPAQTLLSCSSSVEQVINGNITYTIECDNDTGDTIDIEVPAEPFGCCNGTDDKGQPNQIRCDMDVVLEEDDPETEAYDPVLGTESVCTDYLTDDDNCGDCGNVCGDDETCSVGVCEKICEGADDEWCGEARNPDDEAGFCADLDTSADSCGECGNECGFVNSTLGRVDRFCDGGGCATCPLSARTVCDDTCVDLNSDADNCGECGRSCDEECGGSGGICIEGDSCACENPSAPLVFQPEPAESRTKQAEPTSRRKQRGVGKLASAPGKAIEPPAPLCISEGSTLTIETGATISECFASPKLPIEVTGSLIACGGLIPNGSPLCAGNVGTSGIFQRFEPGPELPGEIELSVIGLQVDDGAMGNNLIETGETVCMTIQLANAGTSTLNNVVATLSSDPIDLDCGQINGSTCVPDGDNVAEVNIVQAETPYPDVVGIAQVDPENNSCFDDDGNRFPTATAGRATNLVPVCVEIPAGHPGDIVRPFNLQLTGDDDSGQPFQVDVPFALGIASACDLGPGNVPDTIILDGPLPDLVPTSEPVPFSTVNFTDGVVLGLSLTLTCADAPVTPDTVTFGPRILSLEGKVTGDHTPENGGFVYNEETNAWDLDLPTEALDPDTFVLTLRVTENADFHTGFVLCGDTDLDGTNDCDDECPDDPDKDEPGVCGCGVADTDSDGDGVEDCIDGCPLDNPDDSDSDGVCDSDDGCPNDSDKIEEGICGCGESDADSDGDGVADCDDACPNDSDKIESGICGCGESDADRDGDGTADCEDGCPDDSDKIEEGICGCGESDADRDGDGTADCQDGCPDDSDKIEEGICGCGESDADSDGDGVADCDDGCPDDSDKIEEGICGCGESDADSDGDGVADCDDGCPDDSDKIEEGICGCGESDADSDGDGVADCDDGCPEDGDKLEPGTCGCNNAETDTDGDGDPDCIDPCGDGVVDDNEQCDDGNAVDGDGCSAQCVADQDCELGVVKTCFVPSDGDDDDDDDCYGDVTAMKLEYTGSGCAGLTNLQGGKATCEGGMENAEPISVKVLDDRGREVYADAPVVLLGDVIEATAANAGRDKFGPTTQIRLGDGEESISFHTSCSKPLHVGDQFGSMRLVEISSTGAGTITLPDPTVDLEAGAPTCAIPAVPPTPHCEGKIQELGMRYVDSSCADSTGDQGDKFSCNGDSAAAEPVRIVCTRHDQGAGLPRYRGCCLRRPGRCRDDLVVGSRA